MKGFIFKTLLVLMTIVAAIIYWLSLWTYPDDVEERPDKVQIDKPSVTISSVAFPPPLVSLGGVKDEQKLTEEQQVKSKATTSAKNKTDDSVALYQSIISGNGPVLELIWPDNRKEKEALYHVLHCAGMRLGVYENGQVRLIEEYDKAKPFSELVRFVSGSLSAEENKLLQGTNNGTSVGNGIVRLMPMFLDLTFISILSAESSRLSEAHSIRGYYRLTGNSLSIINVTADKQRIVPQIKLWGPITTCLN